MGFLALLLVAFAAWAVLTGRLQRMTMKDGVMLGLAIVGAVMAARGRPLFGAGALGLAAAYGIGRSRKRGIGAKAAPPADPQAVRDARALLGLEEDADEDMIRAAHRRLIAKIHPDAGGTEALAEKINQARSLLLRHALETRGSHSPTNGPTR
ncbi:MAG: J domain-containing protein [Sphingobium sp.]